MKIYTEKSLGEFQPWAGALHTYERICNAGLLDDLEAHLEAEYPDGIDETCLNDLFWFDSDYILSCCGLRSESEIQDELSDARSQLQDLLADYSSEAEDMASECDMADDEELRLARQKLYDQYYRSEIEDLESTISDLERELKEC